jgi:hypothetical protein
MAHDSGLSKPAVAGTKPKSVTIEAGRDYHWCACGHRLAPIITGGSAPLESSSAAIP